MTISYTKLLRLFSQRGITSYTLTKKDKIIGQATYKNIHDGKHIDTRTIDALCKYLEVQPADILEYVHDDDTTTND